MSIYEASHDSLPYIESSPSDTTRASIQALIISELDPSSTTQPHPNLPPSPKFAFTPLLTTEHTRIASSLPLTAIDTARYESLDPPSPTSTTTSPSSTTTAYQTLLLKAYTSSTYLSSRVQNLSLLETFGKNAFLIGNAQLEEILEGLERDIEDVKGRQEGVEKERWEGQEMVRGEMEGLEEGWRKGVGRLVEVLVAAEGVRGKVEGLLREGRGGE
ncbi:hypothetical protein MMC25_003710 [Agyrium rufum]|nr:hypothetical protein [Agyrium rufum]